MPIRLNLIDVKNVARENIPKLLWQYLILHVRIAPQVGFLIEKGFELYHNANGVSKVDTQKKVEQLVKYLVNLACLVDTH